MAKIKTYLANIPDWIASYWPYILIVVIVVLVLALLFWWWRSRRKKQPTAKPQLQKGTLARIWSNFLKQLFSTAEITYQSYNIREKDISVFQKHLG